ncbi:MAG TPA: alpha/beta hydrolase [Anaerolineales bacterium]|nr:alpha/beta hydrolase [Anaerolineales bacterium]
MNASYLYLNGLRVHYLHESGAGGPPIVLLHGLASNARIWEKTAPTLAAGGFELFAPDMRGHGLSDKTDGDYGFPTHRADLAHFIRALDLEHPMLVGHSWGAAVALDYAAAFAVGPLAPSGIALVDGADIQMNQIPGATWESMRQRLTPPSMAGTPVEDFTAMLENPGRAWQPDEQDISIILANFELDEQECIHPRLTLERHMQIVRAMWTFETIELYRKIACPALLLPAQPPQPRSAQEEEHLAIKRQAIERIQGTNTQVTVSWLMDTVHDAPLQRPDMVAQKLFSFARQIFTV